MVKTKSQKRCVVSVFESCLLLTECAAPGLGRRRLCGYGINSVCNIISIYRAIKGSHHRKCKIVFQYKHSCATHESSRFVSPQRSRMTFHTYTVCLVFRSETILLHRALNCARCDDGGGLPDSMLSLAIYIAFGPFFLPSQHACTGIRVVGRQVA